MIKYLKESVRKHFMEKKKILEDNLHFDKLDSDTLILISEYLRVSYIFLKIDGLHQRNSYFKLAIKTLF